MKHKYTFAALAAFAFMFASQALATLPAPTSATFAKGAKFTVAGYAEGKPALTNFPVLVRIANDSPKGFSYTNLASSVGDDLCFIKMDRTGLPFEIDTWNTNGTSLIWVTLPTMTNGTEFVMCWGGGTRGKTVCSANPWIDYVGVWHMSEASGTVKDSTDNGFNATPSGTAAATACVAVTGPVGNGRQCSTTLGADNLSYLSVSSYDSKSVGDTFAVSGWFDIGSGQTGNDNDARLFSRKEDYKNTHGWEVLWKTSKEIRVRGAASGDNIKVQNLDYAGKGWKHFFIVYNGKNSVFYENGVQKGSKTGGTAATENGRPLAIGGYANNNGSQLLGSVDECRLLDAVPSADWAAAEYASMADPGFLSADEAEDYGGDIPPAVSVTFTDWQYTNTSFTVSVGSIGTGAENANVSVAFSAFDTLASPLWTTNYTVQGVDAQAVPLTGLTTGTTYYVQAQIVNNRDVTNTSPVVAITTLTPGAPSGTALFLERGFTTLSARATATNFGTGAESATVRFEASADGFTTVAAYSECAATLGETATLMIEDLTPGTEYALRVRIQNDWGVDTYIELPSAYTRAVPFATTGIGWTFSPDGSTIDISFGISGVYNGATGSATLTYNGTDKGAKEVTGATTLTWSGLSAASGAAVATIVLSATLDGQPYSQTFSATITPGSMSVAVADFAEHQSAETSVRVNISDVITLPELAGTDFYYLGNNRFGSLEGNVLTATEPGILGVFCVSDDGATTNTLPVIVLPEKIGNGDIYILKDGSIGNSAAYWDDATKWEKVGSETNDSWPHNPDDIAILGYWRNTGAIQFAPHSSTDITIGALYFGNFRNAESKAGFRNIGKLTFSRTDGKPGLVQFCANDRVSSKSAILLLQDSIASVEFPCGVVLDGGWDGVADNCPLATFEFNAPSFVLLEGKALLLQNFSPSRSGEGTTFGKPFTGGGVVWNRSAGNFNWTGEALAGFTGTLRDSSHGAASFGYQAPLFVRSPGSNTVGEVVGFVSANSDANPQVSASSVGILQTGFNQSYRDALIHQDPWFTGRGLLLHGGTYNANAVEHVWGYGKADKKIGDVLTLSGGLNFLSRSWSRDQLSGYPINWVEFKSLVHEDKSSLVLWGDFWSNGGVSTADKTITIDVPKGGPVITETIPAGSVKTNHVMIISGVSSHAVGPSGNPQTTALHPVVPWMLAPANNSGNGWNALAFATFDENGWLVAPLRAEVASLTDAEQGADVAVQDKSIGISSDVTVNSLLVNNQNKSKTLGEGRTLTVTSGGLILHGSGAIGTESGGAANGSLVLGDATHPAYVWARGKASGPNNLWAKVTALGGFVSAYSGNLILGGDQTGIAGEIAVNAGSLQLGTADNSCQLAKDMPIRIYANATLKLPNASSATGNILKFDGAAGWFGKVEVSEGVAAKCRKAYWRDYPETPEWQAIKRGVYTGDEATALSTGAIYDPDRFSGAGTVAVLKDDSTVPFVILVR